AVAERAEAILAVPRQPDPLALVRGGRLRLLHRCERRRRLEMETRVAEEIGRRRRDPARGRGIAADLPRTRDLELVAEAEVPDRVPLRHHLPRPEGRRLQLERLADELAGD